MTNGISFTIVTPSFNQARFLRSALRSVIQQNRQDVEYFVYDGGSTDESQDIIRSLESGITYWQSKPDGGQSCAIDEGLRRGRNDICAWINSDDLLWPGALTAVAEHFAREPDTDVLIGGVAYANERGYITRCHAYRPPSRSQAKAGVLAFAQQSMFFRRGAYLEVGGLSQSLHYLMDTDLVYRFLFAGMRFRVVPELLGVFRWHGEMKSINRGGRKAAETAALRERYEVKPDLLGMARLKSRGERLLNGVYIQSALLTALWRGTSTDTLWDNATAGR